MVALKLIITLFDLVKVSSSSRIWQLF